MREEGDVQYKKEIHVLSLSGLFTPGKHGKSTDTSQADHTGPFSFYRINS